MAHLFLIAGHGDGDPGAAGNGYTEAERVRALANRIKELGGGDVTLGDTSRNWYADNLISSLDISRSWQIVELHMDGAVSYARGGHVIIQSGLGGADQYDERLAAFISEVFPGRAKSIVERNDLANPGSAAAKGYPYRLLECGFITSQEDIEIFNSSLDDIAAGILECFDISSKNTVQWMKDPKGWWYKRTDGSWPKNQWEFIDGKWYYFDGSGYALSNQWVYHKDKWYYLTDSCDMATGWIKLDAWYYLDSSGAAVCNAWFDDGKNRYWFDQSCRMRRGWQWINDAWYYLNDNVNIFPEGAMLYNVMITRNGKQYYLKDSGKMARNENLIICGREYVFNDKGEVQ